LKLSREIKTAILVISAILLFIWGYSFLKGKDLFINYKSFYVEYQNVEGLSVSAPITLNGLNIGKVSSIIIDNKTGKLVVELQVKTDFPISKSSMAEIYSSSLIGGKQIAIILNKDDKSIAVSGDYLKSSSKLGLTESLSQQMEPLKDKIEKLLDNANVMLESVNSVLDAKTKENLKNSLANLNETLIEFKEISKSTNSMLAENKSKIGNTMSNFEKTSANFSKVSDSLAKINIGPTVKSLENTLANVDKMMTEMQSGKGTMGKLMKDETMYNNFTKSSKELELLLQDLRLHPTRYVNVSLFGKKEKPYVAPTKDSIK